LRCSLWRRRVELGAQRNDSGYEHHAFFINACLRST
jgi:hypothetical protein